MVDSIDLLTSLVIPPTILHDSAQEKLRPPHNKKFSLITSKPHPSLPLAIHNYNQKSLFLRTTWDDLSLAARSLVTEIDTGNVVSRSMPKFFNFHEKWGYKPTGDEYAWRIEEKLDGSLISLFWYDGAKKWMIVSRSSFEDNSAHAASARRILEKKYPRITDQLDKEVTYVFELVDPKLPIRVKYEKEDLYLLSIVAKDGKEPPYDFDWSTLPFPRPRTHGHDLISTTASSSSQDAHTPDLKELSRLNLDNEEGFVVLFWATKDDRYPKRVKVKFESYLDSARISPKAADLGKAMTKISLASSTPVAPSNASILEIYTNQRLKIQTFKASSVSSTMDRHKAHYLQSLASIADDYGGSAWLSLIEKTWNRINALISLQEAELVQKMVELQKQGYRPGPFNANSGTLKDSFERRLKKNDVDPGFRDALMKWFLGEPGGKQVAAFVGGLEIPRDLKSQGILKAL